MPFFDQARAVAPLDYSRWWVALAAVCLHASIGQLYAFSVFNLPLTQLIGVTESAAGDWTLAEVGWIFGLANATAGLTAAVIGSWVDRFGPRAILFAAALCFGGGFWVAALGTATHTLALVYIGYGVLGGVGIGLAYITPVAVLLKWFPDRPGLASGIAIMGFGAGAIIGAPLAVNLMSAFATPEQVGVTQTMLIMGTIYAAVMVVGVWLCRLPAPNHPFAHSATTPQKAAGGVQDVPLRVALSTRTFYMLWLVLFLNVTAGLALISQASTLIQQLFPLQATVAVGALFVTVLSAGNMLGRIGWSSLSDVIGRRLTFNIILVLGASLYFAAPLAGNSIWIYIALCVVMVSLYGGGFATIPAYVKDMFGLRYFASIYGPILTAWSAGGLLGSALINYLHASQLAEGVPVDEAYGNTMHVIASLFLIALVCNGLVRRPEPRIAVPRQSEA